MLSALFSSSDVRAAQAQPLADANTAFALDLYGQLKTQPGNLFFSPYSISSVLAMIYAGAKGDTEKQIRQVLHLDGTQPQLPSAFGALQRQLNEASQQNGIELGIANALWAQQGHPFLPAFANVARDYYQAKLGQADFMTEAEAARKEINQWVTQQTKDKIHDILPPGSLDNLTRLVLANAIYFKGVWQRPFDKNETSTRPFHLSAGGQVDVPLMHHVDNVRYTEEPDFQVVELPYKGAGLSMVVLLPRQADGCIRLEDRLAPTLLSRSLGQMRQQKVELFLPRFQLQSSFDLKDTLAKMGMPNAFGPQADFSGMDGARHLAISGVFHKAWGEVNEEGTEAAAATAGTIALTSVMKPPPPPPVFRADHPFIFFMRDTRSGSVLFLGRLTDPRH